MPKLKYKDIKLLEDGEQSILSARRFYETKYYGMFINAFEFPELDQEQQHYLLKQLWSNGSVACFVDKSSIPDKSLKNLIGNQSVSSVSMGKDYPNGLLILAPYATSAYNTYDYPTIINLINTRASSFIPTQSQIVNKDVVIIYAHSSHASVRSLVMFYVNKIVDVENTIETNLFVHKMPRLIVCSPEDKMRVEQLMTKIKAGEKAVFLDVADWQAIKNVLESGGTYIIDKLYQYKQSLENELLTLLGFDNIGLEKRERLIVDEANSNNAVINDHSDCFLDTINAGCKQITDILGFPLSVVAKSAPSEAVSETTSKYDEEDEQDETN